MPLCKSISVFYTLWLTPSSQIKESYTSRGGLKNRQSHRKKRKKQRKAYLETGDIKVCWVVHMLYHIWALKRRGREGGTRIGKWPRPGAEAHLLKPPTNLRSPWKLQLLHSPVSKGPYWIPSLAETPRRSLHAAPEGPGWGKMEWLVLRKGEMGLEKGLKATGHNTQPLQPDHVSLPIIHHTQSVSSWASDQVDWHWPYRC